MYESGWREIESAPKTGRTLLLGYWNSHGKWRTVRGQWMSAEYIGQEWEEPDDVEPGWFETAVEADDVPNCWPVTPSHWQPMPAPPCLTCNDQGAVGNILTAERCPDCSPSAPTSHPIPTGATGEDGRSATYGMTLGERIAHVGGRTNAQGYTEFGSPMAVNALIQHVLRDLDWTRQDDDGAYQARYRLPGGEWSSWGHVVCGVKGHEQELRYLPGERRPAPAAGDALALALAALENSQPIMKHYTEPNERHQRAIEAVRAAIAPPLSGDALTAAARDVLAERQRQISAEGWTPEHDDAHTDGALAQAAACYAASSQSRDISYMAHLWPWSTAWWKPGTSRGDLLKAGALILAEIERQDRARATFEAQRKWDA